MNINAAQPKPTILCVDDDALIAMSTVDMLEDLGFRVIEAHSGQEALDCLSTHSDIALLMTDYSMPNMTGLELATIVRRTHPDLPVLLATGYADLPTGEQIPLPRIAKPYMQSHLKQEIDKLLKTKTTHTIEK